jgi:hypothetical protein
MDRGTASAINSLNVKYDFQKYIIPILTVYASNPVTTDWAMWKITDVVLNRGNGIATTAISYANGSSSPSLANLAPTASSAGFSATSLSVSADTTHGGLNLTGTGIAATTIDWSTWISDGELR